MACPEGLEPPTPSLEGWCSIQLSYGQKVPGLLVGVAGFELATYWSQTSCATRLRYTPKPAIVPRPAGAQFAAGARSISWRDTSMHWRMCCSQTNLSAEKVSAADTAWPAIGTYLAAC